MPIKTPIIAVALLIAPSVQATCKPAVLGEAPGSYLSALSKRLERTGVLGLYRSGEVEAGSAFYALAGSALNLVARSEDGMLLEIGSIVNRPTKADLDRQLTLSAFTIERFSGRPEREAKAELERVVEATSPAASSTLRSNEIVAVITRLKDSYVIKVGKMTCR